MFPWSKPMKIQQVVAVILASFLVSSCGVKGRPQVPDNPPLIGSGMASLDSVKVSPTPVPLLISTPTAIPTPVPASAAAPDIKVKSLKRRAPPAKAPGQ